MQYQNKARIFLSSLLKLDDVITIFTNIYIYYIIYMRRQKVGVFVYGDIGRSPRMQNHAQELSKSYDVYFMGYIESSPRTTILENPNIHLVDLDIGGLGKLRKISFWIYAIVRILLQILQIIYLLGIKHRNLQFVLIQNPPSIPNLFAIWLTSFIAFYQIYIDFHNYGYTILSLKVKNRLIIKLAEKYEKFFGKRHARSFCVSDAMKEDLKNNWGIQATTLYDRPRANFVSSYSHNFWQKYKLAQPTENQFRIVSSTSWTKDEDFSILLNAIEQYDKSDAKVFLRAFITGKGPEKQFYLAKIAEMRKNWSKVSIDTVWLDADDYPVLLSLCHLGVCLHYSSSGFDLPMKVVDMFGAGLPVLAIKYKCIEELVKNGKNGYTFEDSQDLYKKIYKLSEGTKQLQNLKKEAYKQKDETWQTEWGKKFNRKA